MEGSGPSRSDKAMGSHVRLGKVEIKLNEQVIAGMTMTPAGLVGRWTSVLTYDIREEAMALTAAGTTEYGRGQLARSYNVSMGAMGRSGSTFHLKNRKRYAAYVFRGTTGPIRSRKGRLMPVGKSQMGLGFIRAPKGTKFTLRSRVDHQTGHNYPMKAAKVVFARRGL